MGLGHGNDGHSAGIFSSPEGKVGASAGNEPIAAGRVAPATFSRTMMARLEEARQVGRAAQKPEYASVWAIWGVDAGSGALLESKVAECDELLQRAVNARGGQKAGTGDKSAAKSRIVTAMRRVQSGARLRAEDLPPQDREAELQRFFVGEQLSQNDLQLNGMADAMLLLLAGESLPGVGAAQVSELRDAIAQFVEAGAAQTDAGDSSQGLRAQAEALLQNEVSPLRRKLQLAIDGEFPYTDLEHRAARKEFDLPPARPFA